MDKDMIDDIQDWLPCYSEISNLARDAILDLILDAEKDSEYEWIINFYSDNQNDPECENGEYKPPDNTPYIRLYDFTNYDWTGGCIEYIMTADTVRFSRYWDITADECKAQYDNYVREKRSARTGEL